MEHRPTLLSFLIRRKSWFIFATFGLCVPFPTQSRIMKGKSTPLIVLRCVKSKKEPLRYSVERTYLVFGGCVFWLNESERKAQQLLTDVPAHNTYVPEQQGGCRAAQKFRSLVASDRSINQPANIDRGWSTNFFLDFRKINFRMIQEKIHICNVFPLMQIRYIRFN